MSAYVEKRDARRHQVQRRAEDLSIAVGLIVKSVPAVDDLLRALEGSGCNKRLANALRTALAERRGRR